MNKKTRQRIGFDLRPGDYESHALTTQRRTLNKSQTLATNKAEDKFYEISNATACDYSKIATKYANINELIFVS